MFWSSRRLILDHPLIFSYQGEESEDFKHLPPTQRQKRLQTKIDALNSQVVDARVTLTSTHM